MDEDIYGLAGTERGRAIKSTPGTLEEALMALQEDHQFLLQDGVFTDDVIKVWIDTKRESEIEYIRLRPHPGEFLLYFNV